VTRRAWWWLLQSVLLIAVAVGVGRQLAAHWAELRATPLVLKPDPAWLAVSTLLVGLTYVVQVQSWRGILAGWAQRLAYRDAAGIWFLANLGRYVPGKVWSIAGLVVLAERRGVAPWAGTASAVAVQALGIGTAAALVALATPGAESGVRLVVAGAVATGTVGVLAWPAFVERTRRLHPMLAELRPLPAWVLSLSAALTFASWVLYGLAFWSLAKGLGLPPLTLTTAAGVFALGYVVGLLALFAPGGAVVREGVFAALLAPSLGLSGALVLTLASRVQLTVTEAASGIAALALLQPKKEIRGDATGT
jgi:hypothetical protein